MTDHWLADERPFSHQQGVEQHDAGLMGFADRRSDLVIGDGGGSSVYSGDGFSSVGTGIGLSGRGSGQQIAGGPLHRQQHNSSSGDYLTSTTLQAQQQTTSFGVSRSASRTPGTKWAGGDHRGVAASASATGIGSDYNRVNHATSTMAVGDRTPLFGSPPTHSPHINPYSSASSAASASSLAALRSTRARDRRRLLGRMAVKATQPGALFVLVGLAAVMMLSLSSSTFSSSGGGGGGSAGDLTREMAAELLSQAAFGATADAALVAASSAAQGGTVVNANPGNGLHIVQPANLQEPLTGHKAMAAKAKMRKMGQGQEGQEVQVQIQQQPVAQETNTNDDAEKATQTAFREGVEGDFQQQQQQQQPAATETAQEAAAPPAASTATDGTPVDAPSKGDAANGILWLLDQDGNKKAMLVPKDSLQLTNVASAVAAATEELKQTTEQTTEQTPAQAKMRQKQSLLQKLGLKKPTPAAQQVQPLQTVDATDVPADVATYYYDAVVPAAARTTTGPGEEPPAALQATQDVLPEVVYDASGNSVRLVDVGSPKLKATSSSAQSSGEKQAPPHPPHPPHPHPPSSDGSSSSATTASATANKAASQSSGSFFDLASQPQGTTNQLIVISTVATMALFGGALVARKMRSRNFLNSCIENESLEDELAFDAAHTTLGAAVGYDTFSSGDMKWRGDLEKFDV